MELTLRGELLERLLAIGQLGEGKDRVPLLRELTDAYLKLARRGLKLSDVAKLSDLLLRADEVGLLKMDRDELDALLKALG